MLENQIPPTPVLIEDLGMMFPTKTSNKKARYWIYKCSCGKEFKSCVQSIKQGKTMSCGCYHVKNVVNRNTTHSLSRSNMYKKWSSMIQRTTNPLNDRFSTYGGRGILVCDKWKIFENFYNDMFPTYIYGLTIDRINVDGNYKPDNCRWATKKTQSRNTKRIKSSNTSGYRGVSYHKKSNKYRVRIGVDGVLITIGSFYNASDGAKAYDRYVIEHNLEHTLNGVLI